VIDLFNGDNVCSDTQFNLQIVARGRFSVDG